MTLARQIMRGTDATVHIDHSLREAKARLGNYETDHLLVLDGDEVVGYLDRETIETVADEAPSIDQELAGNLMDTRLKTCRPDDDLTDLAFLFDQSDIGLVVVVDKRQQLLGWIARADMLPEAAAKSEGEGTGQESSGDRPKGSVPTDKLDVYTEKPHIKPDDPSRDDR